MKAVGKNLKKWYTDLLDLVPTTNPEKQGPVASILREEMSFENADFLKFRVRQLVNWWDVNGLKALKGTLVPIPFSTRKRKKIDDIK